MSAINNKKKIPGLSQLIVTALKEDAPCGDVTSMATVPKTLKASGHVVAKGDYVVSGMEAARQVYRTVDSSIGFKPFFSDGQRIKKGQRLYSVKGNARSILLAERTALNIVSHMMGIATRTSHFVELVKGTGVTILDTRKTMPGMRGLQRKAVRDGGASNHRFSLSHAVLVKENHIAMCGGIANVLYSLEKISRARKGKNRLTTEIEVQTLAQLEQILSSRFTPNIVMLDNMSPAMVKKAVRLKSLLEGVSKPKGQGIKLEVSGGVDEKTIRAYAKAGVDFISLGTLTHSVKNADLSFLFD